MTEAIQSTELARQDGVERRIVRLSLTAAGIDLSAQDLGPTVEKFWGDSDYEFGVKLATSDLPKLAYALIEKHYRDRLDAIGEMRTLVAEHGIEANYWAWA